MVYLKFPVLVYYYVEGVKTQMVVLLKVDVPWQGKEDLMKISLYFQCTHCGFENTTELPEN